MSPKEIREVLASAGMSLLATPIRKAEHDDNHTQDQAAEEKSQSAAAESDSS